MGNATFGGGRTKGRGKGMDFGDGLTKKKKDKFDFGGGNSEFLDDRDDRSDFSRGSRDRVSDWMNDIRM